MELKMLTAVNLHSAISDAQQRGIVLKRSVAIRLELNRQALAPIIDTWTKQRKEILEKWALRDNDGKPLSKTMLLPNGQSWQEYSFSAESVSARDEELAELNEEIVAVALALVQENQLPEEMDARLVAGLFPILELETKE